jgi:hypothetical protein
MTIADVARLAWSSASSTPEREPMSSSTASMCADDTGGACAPDTWHFAAHIRERIVKSGPIAGMQRTTSITAKSYLHGTT